MSLAALAVLVAAIMLGVTLVPLATGVDAVVRRAGRLLTADGDVAFPRLPERSTIYAADGSVLAKLYLDENRKIVRLGDVPRAARRAVLAIEDAGFYDHPGVDYTAVLRAIATNVVAGEIRQGASTITQQLARNALPSVGSEETLRRKVREARMALQIEREYTKRQILELYLNEVYLGHGVYGLGTAAEFYFGTPLRRLKLPEFALLAGMIASPETYSPIRDRDAARARRGVVLERLVELGWIRPDRAERADGAPVRLSPAKRAILRRPRTPYFVEFIKRRFLELRRFGETRDARVRTLFQGGLQIYTTLDPNLRRRGREIVRRYLPMPADPAAALVAIRPQNGAIRAVASGAAFRRRKFDVATQARRQAGSAFKPFTLVTALRQGISPLRTYDSSSPTVIPLPGQEPWRVHNASRSGYGRIDLREATRNSVNVVFAQLIMDVGPRAVVRTARRMGIDSPLPAVPSLALGTAGVTPLEMASAYATLANAGVRCEPFAIRRIVDRDGEVRMRRSDAGCERAIPTDVATRTVAMLKRVMVSGTGTAARLGDRPAFGKTGTTDDYADAWFVGCTAQLCASTWVGHPEGRVPMTDVHGIRVFGGTFPARIWRDFMAVAVRSAPLGGFPEPPPLPPSRDASAGEDDGPRDGEASGGTPSPSASPSPAPGPAPDLELEPEPSPDPPPEPSPEPSPSPTPLPGPTPTAGGARL